MAENKIITLDTLRINNEEMKEYIESLGIEPNQNAFSNVVVGTTTIEADNKTDSLTLVAGSNVTITPDVTNDKITISATDTDTHYESKNVVTSSNISTSNTTSAIKNNSVYLNSVENNKVTSSHKISGTGATTIETDTSGNIIVNGGTIKNAIGNTSVTTSDMTGQIANGNVRLNCVNGTNVTSSHLIKGINGAKVTWDNTDGSIVIDSQTYSISTTSADGLMSKTDKTKLNATNIAYGTCATVAATAEKVINISGNTNWTLTAGSMITIKFSYTNTASNPTFNVNGTGAKKIWYNTALLTTTNLSMAGVANRPMNFIYDGSQYVFIGWSVDTDTNSQYSNETLGQGYGTCATLESLANKSVTLSDYTLTVGGIVAVKFTYAVTANATMNINGKGAKNIYYRGSAITNNVIKAGDIATFIYDGTQYHLLTIDVSTNATCFNVKDYGAKGDGLTDDTTAIKNTVTALLNNNGGILYFPNGNYVISNTITLSSSTGENNNIEIKGDSFTNITFTGTGDLFLFSTDTKYLNVDNFCIDASSQSVGKYLFKFTGCLYKAMFSNIQTGEGVCAGFFCSKQTGIVSTSDLDEVWFENISIRLKAGTSSSYSTGFKIGSGSSVWIYGCRVIGAESLTATTRAYTTGIHMIGGMGGIAIENCDLILNTYGIKLDNEGVTTREKNREVFIDNSYLDSCYIGYYDNSNVSYTTMTGVWIATSIQYGIQCNNSATLNITGGIFSNNGNNGNGDINKCCMALTGTTNNSITVTGVEFISNYAGLLINDTNGSVLINGCKFISNTNHDIKVTDLRTTAIYVINCLTSNIIASDEYILTGIGDYKAIGNIQIIGDIAASGNVNVSNVNASNDINATNNISAGNDVHTKNKLIFDNTGSYIQNTTTWQMLLNPVGGDNNYSAYLGRFDESWTFAPSIDNHLALGTPNYKWGQIYSSVASISTSDRNSKHDIVDVDSDIAKDFIMSLCPVTYRLNSIENDRKHWGLIAQDVEDAMSENGLKYDDFAGLHKDTGLNGEDIYGLGYTEFIAPLIKVVQMQQKEIELLKQVINK